MNRKLLSIKEYIAGLINQYSDIRIVRNTEKIINRMLQAKTTQLKVLAHDSHEYDNMHNLLNGELKNVLDVAKLNKVLTDNSLRHLTGELSVIIIHDGCDIRKPESEKLEHLGWVRSLEGRWIRGYSTHNCIMLIPSNRQIHLLSSIPYSNKAPNFVSEKELSLYERGKLDPPERVKEIEQALEKNDNHNSKSICKEQIISIHNAIKAINPEIVITHLLDRGYDSEEIMELIDNLGDRFVIRFKKNRNSTEKVLNDKGNEVYVKLAEKTYEERYELRYEKILFNQKTYLNPKGIFEWDTVIMGKKVFYIERVRFYDSSGRNIFKEPMLLITNISIRNENNAQYVYHQYLKRPKIESVFKFIKEVLGWEEFRIQDFESIKNLIALAFFVGGYFYENQDELTKNETVKWIALLGGGKGSVTRYFFMEGLKILIQVSYFKQFVKELNISDEEIQQAYDNFTCGP